MNSQKAISSLTLKTKIFRNLHTKFVHPKFFCLRIEPNQVPEQPDKPIGQTFGKQLDGSGNVKYIGDFQPDGVPNGKGTLFYPQSDLKFYEGDFVDYQMKGYGKLFQESGECFYEGQIDDSVPDGNGIMYFANGRIMYQGNFSLGEPETEFGQQQNENDNGYFEGKISLGKRSHGTEYYPNKQELYSGPFSNEGYPHTENGKFYSKAGHVLYEGGMSNGIRNGWGCEYSNKGKVYYVGQYKNGKWEDDCCMIYYPNGNLFYKGSVQNNKLEGYGFGYYKSGNLQYEGVFRDNGVVKSKSRWYEDSVVKKIKHTGEEFIEANPL